MENDVSLEKIMDKLQSIETKVFWIDIEQKKTSERIRKFDKIEDDIYQTRKIIEDNEREKRQIMEEKRRIVDAWNGIK